MSITSSRDCPNCGSNHKSKPFATYADGYHCFSCGITKHADRSFNIDNKKPEIGADIKIPALISNPAQFPLLVLKKLRELHVTDEMIYKYEIKAGEDNSLFFSVVVDNKIVRTMQRWYEPRRDYGQGNFKYKPIIHNTENVVVLVEDYISFIRLGEMVSSCCLFGTNIDKSSLESIIAKYDNVVLWLDNDIRPDRNPGQDAARKIKERAESFIYNKYALSSKRIINIATEKDPKAYTNQELLGFLQIMHTDIPN